MVFSNNVPSCKNCHFGIVCDCCMKNYPIMRKYLMIILVIMAYSCSKNDDKKEMPTNRLETPSFSELTENGNAFTGALLVYPCDVATSAYFGNYQSMPDELKIFPATYLIGKNNYITPRPPLLLPLGDYTLLYWGVPLSTVPTHPQPASVEPPMRFGRIMKDAVISLRATGNGSDVYYPVFDYVFARQEIHIGKDAMSANLMRATGGVVVNLSNSSALPFDSAISAIYVEIGEVAKSVNFYTAVPTDFTATVRIPLTISSDRTSASNLMAMLFPSGETMPSITIKITLASGVVKSYTKTLENGIVAGNIVTIAIQAGDILATPESGSFEVEGWTETKEEISI